MKKTTTFTGGLLAAVLFVGSSNALAVSEQEQKPTTQASVIRHGTSPQVNQQVTQHPNQYAYYRHHRVHYYPRYRHHRPHWRHIHHRCYNCHRYYRYYYPYYRYY